MQNILYLKHAKLNTNMLLKNPETSENGAAFQFEKKPNVNLGSILWISFFIFVIVVIMAKWTRQLVFYSEAMRTQQQQQRQQASTQAGENTNNESRPIPIILIETAINPRQQLIHVLDLLKYYLSQSQNATATVNNDVDYNFDGDDDNYLQNHNLNYTERRMVNENSDEQQQHRILRRVQFSNANSVASHTRSSSSSSSSNSENASENNSSEGSTSINRVLTKKRPVWKEKDLDNDCAICLEHMDKNTHQLVYCKYGCGNLIHQVCYDKHIAINSSERTLAEVTSGADDTRAKNPKSCPSCRSNIPLTIVEIGKVDALLKKKYQ